jgi:hypothetical protein
LHAVAQPARIVGDVQDEGAIALEGDDDLGAFEVVSMKWCEKTRNTNDTKDTKGTKDTKASLDTKV